MSSVAYEALGIASGLICVNSAQLGWTSLSVYSQVSYLYLFEAI